MQEDISLQESIINSQNTINNNKSYNNDNSDLSIGDEIINPTRTYLFRECQTEKIGEEITNSFTQVCENQLEIIPEKPIEDSITKILEHHIKCLLKEILKYVISNSNTLTSEKEKLISEIKRYIERYPQQIYLVPQLIKNQLLLITNEIRKTSKNNFGSVISKVSEEINSCYEKLSGNKLSNLDILLLVEEVDKQKQIYEEVINEFRESDLLDYDFLGIHPEFNSMNLQIESQTPFFEEQVFYEKNSSSNIITKIKNDYHKINQIPHYHMQYKPTNKRTKCSEFQSSAFYIQNDSKAINRICSIQSKGIKITNDSMLHRDNVLSKVQQKVNSSQHNKHIINNCASPVKNEFCNLMDNIKDLDSLVYYINNTEEQGKRKKKKKNKKNKANFVNGNGGNCNVNTNDVSDDIVNNFKNILGNSSILSLSIKKITPVFSKEWLTNLENFKHNYSSP